MNRQCSQCRAWKNRNDYGSNQWSKGEGISRCRDCISGCPFFVCQECDRNFNNENELKHHVQVHLPRNIQCDECGEQRFKSHANVQQHIESGCCQGCHFDSHDDETFTPAQFASEDLNGRVNYYSIKRANTIHRPYSNTFKRNRS
jgi:Zinc finger, C2H2 type